MITDRSIIERVLGLYPPTWRDRYGQEVLDLVDELATASEFSSLRLVSGLVVAALLERARSLRPSWRVVAAGAALLAIIIGSVVIVTAPDSGHPTAAAAVTKGTIPSPENGKTPTKKIPDFIATLGPHGLAGYVPKAYLFPGPGQPMVGDIAPVYASDLKTLVGYMYPQFGFIALGQSPGSVPCKPVMVSGQSANGTTYSSTVPCSSTFDAVPSIVGSSLPTAMAQLNAHGLQGVASYQRSSSVPTGRVIGVIPTSGAEVPPLSKLSVVVSLGSHGQAPASALQSGLVVIPTVARLTKDAAMQVLGSKVFARIIYQHSSTVPLGHVVGINPPAGTHVTQGQEVEVLVSLGAG